MNRSFYLHNFDTWQARRSERINEHDLGRRSRGNIQIHKMPGTGALCFVNFSDLAGSGCKFYSYLPIREVYRIAWRAKRLMDRYGLRETVGPPPRTTKRPRTPDSMIAA